MILIELLLSALLLPSIVNANDTVIIDIENINIIPGETMHAAITIHNIENFGSCDLTVNYDPTILEVINVTDGNMSEFYFYIDNIQGILNITAYSLGSLTSDIIQVCEILFRAKNTTINDNVTLVTIEKSLLLSAEPYPYEINHVVTNGTVTIETSAFQTLVEINDLTLNGDENGTTSLTISDIDNLGSIMVSLSFDSDLVSVVDVVDGDLDGLYFYVDNDNGWVNISGYMMNPVSEDYFHVASIVFQATMNASAGDVSLLVIEESELSSADPIPNEIPHSLKHGTITISNFTYQTILSVHDITIGPQGENTSSLTISSIHNLGSFMVSLSFDSDLVSVVDVVDGDLDGLYFYVDNDNGWVNISGYMMNPVSEDYFHVASIVFQATMNASAGDVSLLVIEESELSSADPIPTSIAHTRDHGYISIIASQMPTVIINDVNIIENTTGETTIIITYISDLGSCDLDIRWNASVAKIININQGDFDSLTSNVNNTNGQLMINAYSLSPITNDEFTVAIIQFEAITPAPASTSLQIANSTLLTASPTPVQINHNRISGVLTVIPLTELTVDAGGPYKGKTNTNIQIQASASGGIPPYQFSWDIDDDGVFDDATGVTIDYQWSTTGTKTISVQVKDNNTPPTVANDSTKVTISTPSSETEGSSGGTTSNPRPTAVAQVEPQQATVNELIAYDGSESTDDGTIQSYSWNFGDGTTGAGMTTTHRYTEIGSYQVLLTVTDDQGATDTIDDPIIVTITQANNPPTQPVITGPTTGKKNIPLTFTVTASDPDKDTLSIMVDWDDDSSDTLISDIISGESTTVSHTWSQYGLYTMKVTSKDETNATSNTQALTIAIDVHRIDDKIKGLLIDENSDDVYDIYRDDQTQNQTAVSNHNESWYLIDVDDDGQWDYDYDVITKTLNTYQAASTSEEDNTGIYLLIVLIILLFIVLAYIIYKKDKERREKIKQEKQEEKKREEEQKKQKQKEEEQKASEEKKTSKKKPTKKTTTKKKK